MSSGGAERDDYDDRGDKEDEPIERGYVNGFADGVAVQNHDGECEHYDRDYDGV